MILWTIEIKVQAQVFHESMSLAESEENETAVVVSQLNNYDKWLEGELADHKAGFVLAVHDMTAQKPSDLVYPWPCLTWTGLAEQIREALKAEEIPEQEVMLARHVFGFVRDNLWSVNAMVEKRIEFEHVALLRALKDELYSDCQTVIQELLKPVEKMIEESGFDLEKFSCDKNLTTRVRLAHWATFKSASGATGWICVGVLKDEFAVWLESPKKRDGKAEIQTACRTALGALQKRDAAWQACPDNQYDLILSVPVTRLMVANDQPKWIKDFVEAAFDDLKSVNVVDHYTS